MRTIGSPTRRRPSIKSPPKKSYLVREPHIGVPHTPLGLAKIGTAAPEGNKGVSLFIVPPNSCPKKTLLGPQTIRRSIDGKDGTTASNLVMNYTVCRIPAG